jgi:uncharacterized membrane protein
MIRKYFIKSLGSEKSYIFLKMQLSIFLSIALSIFYSLFRNELYILQIVPAIVLLFSFAELYKKYRKDFWVSCLIFSAIFIIVLLTPFMLRTVTQNASSPLELARYMIYLVFAILLVLILSRTFSPRKDIVGKVLMADRKTAVVEVDFDLLAGIRPGKYVVDNKGAKKGDFVRISVKRGFFRGAHLERITGKRI